MWTLTYTFPPPQMIFTLEPRCDLVVSEPNIKNEKMVNYECECGGRVEKVCVCV